MKFNLHLFAIFVFLVIGIFLVSGVPFSFSQTPGESSEELSEEDLTLIQEYIELAESYYEEGEFDVALSFYDSILEIVPNNIDALNGKALTLDTIGRHQEAILYYDRVLEIDPENDDATLGKVFALDNLGQTEEEISDEIINTEEDQQSIEDISEESLDSILEFFEQAEQLLEEERYEEAISYYDRVLEIDSFEIDALNGKALSLAGIGNHQDAITYYDKVLEIDSSDIDALFGKSVSLESLNRTDESLSNLEKLETLIPPEVEFREPAEPISEDVSQDMADFDQTLFVIVGVFIVILASIIVIDFIAKRKKLLSSSKNR